MTNSNLTLMTLFEIGMSIHHVNKRSERKLGLSLVQWLLLKKLVDMPATPAWALAKATGVHPSTLTQTLRRLEKKKFIFITEDPHDNRKKLISITREGKAKLDLSDSEINAWERELIKIASPLDQVKSHLKTQFSSL